MVDILIWWIWLDKNSVVCVLRPHQTCLKSCFFSGTVLRTISTVHFEVSEMTVYLCKDEFPSQWIACNHALNLLIKQGLLYSTFTPHKVFPHSGDPQCGHFLLLLCFSAKAVTRQQEKAVAGNKGWAKKRNWRAHRLSPTYQKNHLAGEKNSQAIT